jgi:hypothetical protein
VFLIAIALLLLGDSKGLGGKDLHSTFAWFYQQSLANLSPTLVPNVKVFLLSLSVIWAAWTISALHRRINLIRRWELKYSGLPFRGTPLFLHYRDATGVQWRELTPEDFSKNFQSYGLAGLEAIQILIGILVIGYFALIEALG